MFRISQYMAEIAAPTPLGPKRNPPGPVVIWNLIRRCNLTCKHCYSISADTNFPGELSTEQVYAVMDDLKAFKVPALILSGGEPLLRPDIYDIAKRAKAKGFYVGLSSNGTLIDENNIAKIAECDFNYVGVSLDGIRETPSGKSSGGDDDDSDPLERTEIAGSLQDHLREQLRGMRRRDGGRDHPLPQPRGRRGH